MDGCNAGERRPFALKVKQDQVYVGTVCTAENGGTLADMSATVYAFDGTVFTSVLDFPLDYTKGRAILANPQGPDSWLPWTDDESLFFLSYQTSNGTTGHFYTYNQPILSDIEFAPDGSMLLGLMDRGGHQGGWYNLAPTTNPGILWYYATGGDLLIAYQNTDGNSWTIEDNGDRDGLGSYIASASQMNNQGPGGGEFFFNEFFT